MTTPPCGVSRTKSPMVSSGPSGATSARAPVSTPMARTAPIAARNSARVMSALSKLGCKRMVLTQAQALAVTLGVEGALAALIGPRFGARRLRAAGAAVGGSLVTHPFVWWGVLALWPRYGPATTPLLEAAAVAVEALGYRLIATRRWRDAALLSIIANAASWGLGVVLQRWI